MIPEGFSQFLGRFKPERDENPPGSTDAIWDNMVYPLFLGSQTKSAEASYVTSVLWDWVSWPNGRRAQTDPNWSSEVREVLADKLTQIHGSPGEGFKRKILNRVSREVAKGELSRTLASAQDYFENRPLDPELLSSVHGDAAEEANLVAEVRRDIHGIGIVKAVLWLHDCGMGRDLVPPTTHVRAFLRNIYPNLTVLDNDTPNEHTFGPASAKMREVARRVSDNLGYHVSAKRCQNAAWLLYSCLGLISRNPVRRKLTFATLGTFLDSFGWTPDELNDVLGDIERLETLAGDIRSFLKSIP